MRQLSAIPAAGAGGVRKSRLGSLALQPLTGFILANQVLSYLKAMCLYHIHLAGQQSLRR